MKEKLKTFNVKEDTYEDLQELTNFLEDVMIPEEEDESNYFWISNKDDKDNIEKIEPLNIISNYKPSENKIAVVNIEGKGSFKIIYDSHNGYKNQDIFYRQKK